MTAQASKILRAFARGEPIMRIADTCGISYTQAWSQLKRAVAKTEHKNPSPLDTIRLEQYFILTRIVDQAFEAFEKTIKGTAKDIADVMEHWFTSGACDGFMMQFHTLPGGLRDFVESVIPELQRRGLFREDYAGPTLRDHLGLERPANPKTKMER